MKWLLENIIPHFQPIIAADTNTVYSWEVLGRYVDIDGTAKSLGPFFTDENTTNEDALAVDRVVRKKAIKKFAEEGCPGYLFINIRLKWIVNFLDKLENMPTLLWAKEFGVDYSKLVIEITEDEFLDENKDFIKAIEFYKSMGCRIAIDDYGKDASHIDRLSIVSPDIVKIDMDYIHKSEDSFYYREYLKTLCTFAHRVGIEVLYEGIENQNQLDICLSSNGRFYQGFLLAEPDASLNSAVFDQNIFSISFNNLMASMLDKAERTNKRRAFWNNQIQSFLKLKPYNYQKDDINDYFSELCRSLPNEVRRVYICNNQGFQLSDNIERNSDGIELYKYKNRNWAWRKYFQKAMIAFNSGVNGYLTYEYRDATTKEKIYTYISRINSEISLYIDILI